jgi:hypothetical protein
MKTIPCLNSRIGFQFLTFAYALINFVQPVWADTFVFDLDNTVLNEVPIDQKNHPRVQFFRYAPSPQFYSKYEKRISTSDRKDLNHVIHYSLHEETQEITSYVVIRPGVAALLDKIAKDPTHQIIIASSNDPARTQAVFRHLKVEGTTFKERRAVVIPKEVFNPHWQSKSLAAIRNWLKLKEDSKLFAIDDHPEYYVEKSQSDTVIGVSPWDFSHGVTEYLSNDGLSKQIAEQNITEFSQIWKKLFLSNDEYYSERPDVTQVRARKHDDLSPAWGVQRQGHLEAISEILEMYPDYHIFFMARDGELLYDFARTILSGEREQLERIHLINVSRANMNDTDLLPYLAQEGITQENLRLGMKVLFVDTGYSGSIPNSIYQKFPSELRDRFRTHFMTSADPAIPSCRVFLEFFQKGASELVPSSLHSSILTYEGIPHFTFRASTFKEVHQKWEPTGSKEREDDGEMYRRERAQKYQEDLKFYASSPNVIQRWKQQRAFWRKIRKLIDWDETDAREDLKKELEALLSSDEPIKKAMVRDLFEIIELNEPSKAHLLPHWSDLGLTPLDRSRTKLGKFDQLQAHPEWRAILENPAVEIPKWVNGTSEEILHLMNLIQEGTNWMVRMTLVESLLFRTDLEHRHSSSQLFESILNHPIWTDTVYKTFNKRVHPDVQNVEHALKTQDIHLRRQAAISLAYLNGPDLKTLFETALKDEDEEVRLEAARSLRYRNSSLSSPDGDRVQVAGLLWSRFAHDEKGELKMPHSNAVAYCHSLGGRLPTTEEWIDLRRAKGYQVPERHYDPKESFDVEGRLLWSSSVHMNYENYAIAFDGSQHKIEYQDRTRPLSVTCVFTF